MQISVAKIFVVSATALALFVGIEKTQAQTSVIDDPKVKALIEARMAQVRQLSDAEFERAAERSRVATDTNFSKLSKKDIKRLAKLGDAVWLDCEKAAAMGYAEAKTRDLTDKKNLSRVNDERLRTVIYSHMRSKLQGHEKYKSNGIDFEEAKSQTDTDGWRLFVATRGLKCQLDLIDVKLSGDFDNGFAFYGKSSKAADLYRREEPSNG
jgi:hypothetical protein